MSDIDKPCPPHVTVDRVDRYGNGRRFCVGCQRYVLDLSRFMGPRTEPTPDDVKIRPPLTDAGEPAKLSCLACVVNPLGFVAKHACGWADQVAEASGVA